MHDEYYLQDNRQFVGNDLLWWADGGGYTTDISKAEVFTKGRAIARKQRSTDIPWPKEYIDNHTRPVVDCQCVDNQIALSC